jgi:glycosyltransferase involved in cell wall biosynthesis
MTRTTGPIPTFDHPAVPLVLHVIPTTLARGGQREARALADQLDAPGLRLHRVLSLFEGPAEVDADFSIGYQGTSTPGVGFAAGLVGQLRSTLARIDPAVVVAHGSEPLKYLVPAMFGRRKPLIYYAIGTYSGSNRWLQIELWRRLISRVDLVAAEGNEVLEECTSRFGVPTAKVALAPNGRDPQIFHPPPERHTPDDPLVIFVGALTTGKQPARFIELVKELRSDQIRLRAALIGDGPLREGLVSSAEEAGVEMLGSRSDVSDQMRRADLMVFPSRPAGEGMPGVLIEAGLSGLPVVATSVPGVSTIVKDGETGIIVAIDDLSAMVAATRRLVEDGGLRSTMGQAARQRCMERFSLTAVANRWLSFIEPLL